MGAPLRCPCAAVPPAPPEPVRKWAGHSDENQKRPLSFGVSFFFTILASPQHFENLNKII
jgi:hypothetical protein